MDDERKRTREKIAARFRSKHTNPRNVSVVKRTRPTNKEKEKPMDDKLVVIARNPAEMQVAQQKLCDWATRKVETSHSEMKEAEESLAQAKKSKWRQTGFVTNVRYARERLNYYLKVQAALEAGYVIVPNFDLDIFAIRTTQSKPRRDHMSHRYGKPQAMEFENDTDRPSLGEGEYHDPWPELTHTVKQIAAKDGKDGYRENHAEAIDWRNVDFPYKLAKPQVLTDTSKAMACMIFDKIGVTPHRRVRNQDPMVIGQIVCKGRASQEKTVSFLVTWWVDHTDLEV